VLRGPQASGIATPTKGVAPRQRWSFTEPHPAEAAELAKAARTASRTGRSCWWLRGIAEASDAFAFLNPEVSHLHDPSLMLGNAEAVTGSEQAIANREPVLLTATYDVDARPQSFS